MATRNYLTAEEAQRHCSVVIGREVGLSSIETAANSCGRDMAEIIREARTQTSAAARAIERVKELEARVAKLEEFIGTFDDERRNGTTRNRLLGTP